MKKELIKIRDRLLVYSLVTSIAIGVSCCSEDKEDNFNEENVSVEKENSFSKIKEKRIEYGK